MFKKYFDERVNLLFSRKRLHMIFGLTKAQIAKTKTENDG